MIARSSIFLKVTVVFIIIIFLQFFSYSGIPENSKILASATFGLGMLMMLSSVTFVLLKPGLVLYKIDILVMLVIIAFFLSFFTAYGYWDQPFISSLLSYRLFYIFFLYFVLLGFEVSRDSVEHIVSILFFLSLIIFIIDFITFPEELFAWRSEERRNGITVFFYGQGFTFLGAFLYLDKFFKKGKLSHLLFFLIGAAFLFFLTQSRMILLGLGLGFLLILLLSQLRFKYLFLVALMSLGIIVYFFSNMFEGIKEQNAEQAKFYTQDIRVQAHEFFLTDFQGGWPTLIFGNGYPASESKLEAITYYGQDMGFFTSDVGITGIYSFFGLFGALIWILLFYKGFSVKSYPNTIYLKAYFVAILTTAFTGYALFDPGYMPATVLAFYLVRIQTAERKVENPAIRI